jgi:hypothetical protein
VGEVQSDGRAIGGRRVDVWLRLEDAAGAGAPGGARTAASRAWFGQVAAGYGIAIEHRDHRPPVVRGPGGRFVSVSRSRRLAAIAVAGRAVGVDVEPFPEDPVDELLVRRTCTPDELRAWRDLPERERTPVFLRWWVRKEALVKALAGGRTMDSLDVRRRWTVVARRAWWLTDLGLPGAPGHLGAVATPWVPARVVLRWDEGEGPG